MSATIIVIKVKVWRSGVNLVRKLGVVNPVTEILDFIRQISDLKKSIFLAKNKNFR